MHKRISLILVAVLALAAAPVDVTRLVAKCRKAMRLTSYQLRCVEAASLSGGGASGSDFGSPPLKFVPATSWGRPKRLAPATRRAPAVTRPV